MNRENKKGSLFIIPKQKKNRNSQCVHFQPLFMAIFLIFGNLNWS